MSGKNKKDWKAFRDKAAEDDQNEIDGEEELEASDEATEAGALDHPSYIALEEKLTLAEQKAHDNWEKSVRALAELDNVRRRADREVANAHRYGVEKLLISLLPVMDSLEQAIQLAANDSDGAMREGLELTMKLFSDVLVKFDVETLDPIGQQFDPQQHEAMSIQPTADAAPNTVLNVFQKGYRLNDRVIRPARVIVAKAAP